MTIKEYAAPLSQKPVDTISTEDVLAVLRPIWQAKSETASRLRGRIERILDAAKARGHRTGENPAPQLLAKLRLREAVAARALEFLVLSAARTGEVLGATWREFDLADRVWLVPASRMKAGRDHRVPLSDRAMEILSEMKQLGYAPDGYVLSSTKRDRPLSSMAMDMLLRRATALPASVSPSSGLSAPKPTDSKVRSPRCPLAIGELAVA